ncbi:uncharacterized protein LOC133312431 [Gastrolobium bilobum]|uniref:uncharacterized protein LOC133312431 n=1 Tax=Gastrolobium bilobum TaxID=150636 RepID=UPI002AB1335C|nr:uncharacterized protein LOC133312431 [Gastrolobium bilobum]
MANQCSVITEESVEEQVPVTTTVPRNDVRSSVSIDISNQASPYFLHSNENPSLVLVSTLMNGKNYHGWARAMKMALVSKNKFSFVNGTISVPDFLDPRYAAWERCNTMVLSWLHCSIYDSISQSTLWMDKASDVWNDLKERFSQADIFRISDLQDDLYKLRQSDTSVTNYYTQLKILWDELEALQPTLTCQCTHPCCSITSEVKAIRERDYSIRFLKGLNDQFSNVRSQIMLTSPLPSVNRAFSLVMQQERQLHLEGAFTNKETHRIFYNSGDQSQSRGRSQVRGRGRGTFIGRGTGGPSRLCTYCGKTNHTVETCFEKYGYPLGFNQRGAPHKANVTAVPQEQMAPSMESMQSSGDSFTNHQYQTIFEMIQHSLQQGGPHTSNMIQGKSFNADTTDSSSGIFTKQWILDTGATDHITCSYMNLSYVHKIKPIAIFLPNGGQVFSHFSGTVQLSESLKLTNVLFVKEFKVNLISVAKLVMASNYQVIF